LSTGGAGGVLGRGSTCSGKGAPVPLCVECVCVIFAGQRQPVKEDSYSFDFHEALL